MPEINSTSATWSANNNRILADWERELLNEQQEFGTRPRVDNPDDDLDDLIRSFLNHDDEAHPARQPAPTSKPTDRPPTAEEMFALLPIGGRFLLQGPNVGQSYFYTVRTKVSVTHYKRDGESTRRRGDGFSASTKLIRTT
jgi:hypothetical protein